jgi:hypothetical protein
MDWVKMVATIKILKMKEDKMVMTRMKKDSTSTWMSLRREMGYVIHFTSLAWLMNIDED